MRGGDDIRAATDRAVEGNSIRGGEKLAAQGKIKKTLDRYPGMAS